MSASITTSDLVNAHPIVVIPVGSWEQHGPHLPFDTDTRIACSVIEQSLPIDDTQHVVVSPPITISASDEHAGFAGTLSTGTEAFAAAAIGIAKSATWARGVLFVNGHGGNADAFRVVTNDLVRNNVRHAIWSPPYDASDDMHAGYTETSVMLHIAPSVVRMGRIVVGNTSAAGDIMDEMRRGGVRSVSDNGILGDPTRATPDDGREIFAKYCASLRAMYDAIVSKWS
jgi:creatinine amidohydrolase